MIDDGVANDLALIAQRLMDEDPDATFSDLLKAYFKYVTGLDYEDVLDNPPSDEEIVQVHIDGYTPAEIAEELHDHEDYVRWVLLTHGFSPNTPRRDRRGVELEKQHYWRLIEDGIL